MSQDTTLPPIEALAHRIAWRYKKSTDPHHSDTYTFNNATLHQFAAAIAAQAQQPACPSCNGSGEGGSYHVPGTESDFVEGPCRACNGSGEAAPQPEYRSSTPEEDAALDAALDLVLLPAIRISSTAHGLLSRFAKLEGKIVQAVVRDILEASMTAQGGAEPQPEREPLTDAQIEKLREETFSTSNPFCPCDSKTMRKAVWAAERAHGIGTRGGKP